MPRFAHHRAEGNDPRRSADEPIVLQRDAETDTVDEVERKFLEPVARYLAILQEWSMERPPEDATAGPPSKQP